MQFDLDFGSVFAFVRSSQSIFFSSDAPLFEVAVPQFWVGSISSDDNLRAARICRKSPYDMDGLSLDVILQSQNARTAVVGGSKLSRQQPSRSRRLHLRSKYHRGEVPKSRARRRGKRPQAPASAPGAGNPLKSPLRRLDTFIVGGVAAGGAGRGEDRLEEAPVQLLCRGHSAASAPALVLSAPL